MQGTEYLEQNSVRSAMSHAEKCLKYGISHLDLSCGRAATWEFV